MLVERDDVEAEFLGVAVFVEIVVVIVGRLFAIEEPLETAKNPPFLRISSSGSHR